MTESNPPAPLKIVIVGAGIGGLTAALGLRQQGHEVILLEKSRLHHEAGAALHLAPNGHGLLKQFGVHPQRFGANPVEGLAEFDDHGNVKVKADLRKPLSIWQHPWVLVHRAHLHEELKKAATSSELPGPPAAIRTACAVASVNPASGTVVLQDGSTVSGDVVIGADGVNSITRFCVVGPGFEPSDSGKSAFRFLLPRSIIAGDAQTAALVAQDGVMTIWMGDDRRLVMYPCSSNTVMNFVGIHPSHLTAGEGEGWNRDATKQQLLDVYKNFDPTLLAVLRAVDESTLKVWTLRDMDRIPSWTKDRLALLGDAAHPFLPHQGQGGAMAIEDAASLAAVLPRGTPCSAIPERLKLYEKIRDERAHKIQHLTRLAGEDLTNESRESFNIMQFLNYNFAHDEWHNSKKALQEFLWSNNATRWRGPVSFGPMPGPRQDHLGQRRPFDENATTVTHIVRFKTSATYLKTLFPNASFSFASPGTFAEASVVCHEFRNLAWLGGRGYKACGLWFHGVQYTTDDDKSILGDFLAVMFESHADPTITGREELGMPKVFCDIDVAEDEEATKVRLTWNGTMFAELSVGPGSEESDPPAGDAVKDIFWYRRVPAVGRQGLVDAEYLVCAKPPSQPPSRFTTRGQPSLRFLEASVESLPTLHHVASTLAEMPVYEVLTGATVERAGLDDCSSAARFA